MYLVYFIVYCVGITVHAYGMYELFNSKSLHPVRPMASLSLSLSLSLKKTKKHVFGASLLFLFYLSLYLC
jgi:hypothetical protein